MDTLGGRHRVLRDFWPAVIEESMPDSQPVEMLHLRVAYEMLEKDYLLQKRVMPDKVRENLEASRSYNLSAFKGTVKALTEIALKKAEQEGESMSEKKEKSGKGGAHVYIQIFENQAKAQLTDSQICDAVEKATDMRPTEKTVASYRCYFNAGSLSGQKTTPKDKVKAVRPKSDKPAKAKKPMSAETKAKLKAYGDKKKATKKAVKK